MRRSFKKNRSVWTILSGTPVILIGLAQTLYAQDSRPQNLSVTQTQHRAIDEARLRRQQWDLSDPEWSRYQELMHGIRGSISPDNISPIEVLGTHARSDQERQKYAEIWARMRHEDAERILAFQASFQEAVQKLYPNEPVIDYERFKHSRPTQTHLDPGDRLLVFIKLKQCPDCQSLIQRLSHHPQLKTHQIDLYFVDTEPKKDDAGIRQWAQTQGLDAQRLKNRSITLNHDHGNYFKLTQQLAGPLPKVFKLNGNSLTLFHG